MRPTHGADSTPILTGSNIAQLAESLVSIARQRAQWFRTGNVLIPFGNDFYFTSPLQFLRMDSILKYLADNPVPGVTVRYSTVSEYYDAVMQASGGAASFPTAPAVDFFPYVACSPCDAPQCQHVPCGTNDAYWSGFYTSKPAQKTLSRTHDAALREADSMFALRPLAASAAAINITAAWGTLTAGRDTSGLLMHHDALPGTSFNTCTISTTQCDCYADYNHRLDVSLNATTTLVGSLKAVALGRTDAAAKQAFNTDVAAALRSLHGDSSAGTGVVAVALGNGLLRPRGSVVRLKGAPAPPPGTQYTAVDASSGAAVATQFVQGFQGTLLALQLPEAVPALGVRVVLVSLTPAASAGHPDVPPSGNVTLDNSLAAVYFGADGHVRALSTGATRVPVSLSMVNVTERLPNDSNIFTGANVYSYVPTSQTPLPLGPGAAAPVRLVQAASGPLVWEATQVVSPFLNVTYRLFAGAADVEVTPAVGPLPDVVSASVAMELEAFGAVPSAHRMFTDSNGFQVVDRSNLDALAPALIQGRYAPAVPGGMLVSSAADVAVGMVGTRPVGVGHTARGLQVLLHRRLMNPKDHRGNDSSVVATPFLFRVGGAADVGAARHAAAAAANQPISAHALALPSVSAFHAAYNGAWQPVNASLPAGVALVSLQALAPATQAPIGIRLQHLPQSASSTASYPLGAMLASPPVEMAVRTSPDFLRNLAPQPGANASTNAPVVLFEGNQVLSYVFNRLI